MCERLKLSTRMLQDFRSGGISGYAKARAVYISDEIRQRLDFVVRQIDLRGSSISGNIERALREHLDQHKDYIEL
ncbi:hypothetical protein T230_06810 [Tannerella sp. oral taxon BU063 isolate Cell 1/3]|uniref:Uncharacterized protein n=2 Tax=Tannerella serpentiformis TaxID=712710 RepID=W2CNL3_9BACT|nr:hypothetical protein T230_06810 [Tannerella sp. oral taxon BU063 isolate Cell 1/3]ETK11780.1 hypothetical protein T235_13610 [Tannerella sp. oral taxon BU063 isolate Cell 8/11]